MINEAETGVLKFTLAKASVVNVLEVQGLLPPALTARTCQQYWVLLAKPDGLQVVTFWLERLASSVPEQLLPAKTCASYSVAPLTVDHVSAVLTLTPVAPLAGEVRLGVTVGVFERNTPPSKVPAKSVPLA